jgi:hypothetical protein
LGKLTIYCVVLLICFLMVVRSICTIAHKFVYLIKCIAR